jgi:hypothetical protein
MHEEKPEKIVQKMPERAYVLVTKKKGRRKGKWIAAIVVLIVFVFILNSYSTENAALGQIDASISGVETPSIGLTSASFPVTMSFNNRSSSSSPPFTLTYDVSVSGSTVATGSASVSSAPAGATTTAQFTVSISYSGVGSAIWSVISGGNFSITISGRLEAKAVFGLIPITKSFSTSYSL